MVKYLHKNNICHNKICSKNFTLIRNAEKSPPKEMQNTGFAFAGGEQFQYQIQSNKFGLKLKDFSQAAKIVTPNNDCSFSES